jgi:hypothetical protein
MADYLRLRQLCLVAHELAPVEAALRDLFGLAVCHRDGAVAKYGLHNMLFPVGTAFLEVVAPLPGAATGSAAERYLARRGGDGGYMVILDCGDIERRRGHLAEIGVRIANPLRYESYTGLQLHPRDTGGAMLEFNHTEGGEALDGPYHPAGPNWQAAVRTGIVQAMPAAEVQSTDPIALARKWSAIIERPVGTDAAGAPEIRLDLGAIRFIEAADGRGDGLGGIDMTVTDRARLGDRAEALGLTIEDDMILVGGIRFRLVGP